MTITRAPRAAVRSSTTLSDDEAARLLSSYVAGGYCTAYVVARNIVAARVAAAAIAGTPFALAKRRTLERRAHELITLARAGRSGHDSR